MPVAIRRALVVLLLIALPIAATAATSVIVQLAGEPAAMAAARARATGHPMSDQAIESYRSGLAAAQNQFLESLTAKGVAFTIGGVSVHNVRVDFRYTLVFNGINLLVDPSAIPAIEAMPEVKKVYSDDILHTTLDVSVPYIKAPQVYGAIEELTRFDLAHEGYEGQGIYISVIDSGLEWQHEMFGGDPTPPRLGVEPATSGVGRNEKIAYYLPFADAVAEDALGHGTHVASTAAGYQGFAPGDDGLPLTGDDVPLHGVAPQARIMSYKVCSDTLSDVGALGGPVGGCLSSAITMALEDSVSPRTINGFAKPVAHVINMSLGGDGTPDSVTAVAADNAVRAGAVVVAAAGNSGPGESTAGAPCVGRLVICVANSVDPAGAWSFDVLDPSSVNRLIPGAVSPASSLEMASGERTGVVVNPMAGTPYPPTGAVAQYYVYVSGGETPASYPASVSGRIAIVQTNLQATFAQVANSAAAAGAIAVLMRTDTANPTAVKATIPAATVPIVDFDYLVSLMGGAPASGDLSTYPIRLNPFFGETNISDSSSRGPVAGFGQVKPDVSAPGTNIMAALPPASLLGVLAQGNYGSISGTSMASPHVAGSAALVRQAHPSWTPDMVRTALINTSTNLRNEAGVPKGDADADSINEQGGGLIDVEAAVNAVALMGVASTDQSEPSLLGSHSFGEVPAINAHAVVTRNVGVTIFDESGTASTYRLAVANNRGLQLSGISVGAPASIAVPANGSASFDVNLSVDGNAITSGDPIEIQWYVRATRSDGNQNLSMPFYARLTRTVPPAAIMNPVSDDPTPDWENGVDRDGRYVVSWSYPADAVAVPCGYRIEEATPTAAGTLWYDDAEETMLTDGNSKWVSSGWTSRPHPTTLSLGYAPIYTDTTTATLTAAADLDLPSALVTLTFDSYEDFEPDFDYGYVDVSTDGGSTFTQIARYTGAFTGQRLLDLSPFAGHSIRLRFRLVSDDGISMPVYQGWTIDNIRVQAGAAFNAIASVAFGTNSLVIGGKQDGTYAYRVTALFDDCQSNPYAAPPSNILQISVAVATRPPLAMFTANPSPSDVNEDVVLDAGGSHDQDSIGGNPGIAEYHWSFGDGSTLVSTTPTVTHRWLAYGDYRVALTVIDDDGESSSVDAMQNVANSGR